MKSISRKILYIFSILTLTSTSMVYGAAATAPGGIALTPDGDFGCKAPVVAPDAFKILTIDFTSPRAPELLHDSLRTTGFAFIRNHPIPHDLILATLQDLKAFFTLPPEAKAAYVVDGLFGYHAKGTEIAVGATKPNQMEDFQWAADASNPASIKPATKSTMLALHAAQVAMGDKLLDWLDITTPQDVLDKLPMDPTTSKRTSIKGMKGTLAITRGLHYPPLDTMPTETTIVNNAHIDSNLATVLFSTEAGLQALGLDGAWHDAPYDPTIAIVNTGRMLQEATAGYYPATRHQVVRKAGMNAPRYSLPCFLNMRHDLTLANGWNSGELFMSIINANRPKPAAPAAEAPTPKPALSGAGSEAGPIGLSRESSGASTGSTAGSTATLSPDAMEAVGLSLRASSGEGGDSSSPLSTGDASPTVPRT